MTNPYLKPYKILKPAKTFDELRRAEQIERWENVLRVLRALTPHQRRKHSPRSVGKVIREVKAYIKELHDAS